MRGSGVLPSQSRVSRGRTERSSILQEDLLPSEDSVRIHVNLLLPAYLKHGYVFEEEVQRHYDAKVRAMKLNPEVENDRRQAVQRGLLGPRSDRVACGQCYVRGHKAAAQEIEDNMSCDFHREDDRRESNQRSQQKHRAEKTGK